MYSRKFGSQCFTEDSSKEQQMWIEGRSWTKKCGVRRGEKTIVFLPKRLSLLKLCIEWLDEHVISCNSLEPICCLNPQRKRKYVCILYCYTPVKLGWLFGISLSKLALHAWFYPWLGVPEPFPPQGLLSQSCCDWLTVIVNRAHTFQMETEQSTVSSSR